MSLFKKKRISVSEKLIRETAKKIVMGVFKKEYTIDNSQTQRIIKEMLKEAGIENG